MSSLAIHITGASGSGVTTLGKSLSARLGAVQLDTDDYYWLPTSPPYMTPREVPERLELIAAAIGSAGARGWVLSGSIGDWGAPLVPLFQLVVFVRTETAIRMTRLRQRGIEREGADQIAPGGPRELQYREFLDWAAGYDTGINTGRSLAKHETWLAMLDCPVLRVDGAEPTEALADRVLAEFRATR
jgi:adenylate kinase family enzyme